MAITVTFRQRTFGLKIPLSVPVTVERYSWHMIGGPEKAYLSIPAHAEMWELTKLLRCPVEIYGNDGRLNWWGYVNRVTIPHGVQRLGLGLDNLYNYVVVEYSSGTTAAASNAVSIADYGQKEMRLFDSGATQDEGEQTRAIYLAEHEYARPELEFSGGNDQVSIECYGWFQTLGWKYYTNADTTNTENTTQITSMVTSAGQFFRGSIIEDQAGITSSEKRDGKRTALDYINQLLNAGTNNYLPLLARVDKDRFLHVYERDYEPFNEQYRYLLDDEGELYTPLGLHELPEHCTCAVWVQIRNVMSVNRSMGTVVPFFIELAEYDVRKNKTTYRAAGAYEQERLGKYVREKNNPPGPNTEPPTYPPGGSGYAALKFTSAGGTTVQSEVLSGFAYVNNSVTSPAYILIMDFTVPATGFYIMAIHAEMANAGTLSDIHLQITTSSMAAMDTIGSDGSFYGPIGRDQAHMEYLSVGATITMKAFLTNRAASWPSQTHFYVSAVPNL